jgi:aspartyl-tRNA(Asn)/glutamyl-tRNA(Gln) amidotransferase subunit A
MTDLADLSAADLVAGYGRRQFSPVEALDAVLERIAAWEPRLNAFYVLDADGARTQAAASEHRWRTGEPAGPLDGVPVTLKENIATRGCPLPMGTAASDLVPAPEDGPAAARLRETGAVLLGKTTMPDYGMISSGLSSRHGSTRNPWDTHRNPGGSSAGAGAAAAAGYGPLHVGTDIGGSIRLPAGWCGVVGFKPSFGRIPVDPPYPGRTLGPLTRTVADAALLTSVIAAPDRRDHLSLPPTRIPWDSAWTDTAPADLGGLRIGLMLDAGAGLPVEAATVAAVTAAATALHTAGAHVEPVGPVLTREMLDGLDRFWRTRSWLDINALPESRRGKVLAFIAQWAQGADGLSGAAVFSGFAQMDAMAVAAHRALDAYDYLLSPVAPIPAIDAGLAAPTDDPAQPFEHIAFTVPFNMSGQPAISVNCGWTDDGLPIGLQIVGQRFDDLGVLRVAAAYEQLRPAQRPWPQPARA